MTMKVNFKNKLQQDEPSGRSSPVFPWSPLPQRRRLNFVERDTLTSTGDLYPNCDSDVWLRSCEQEILQPLVGNVRGKGKNKAGNCFFTLYEVKKYLSTLLEH